MNNAGHTSFWGMLAPSGVAGVWKNTDGVNQVIAQIGAVGQLGPGLGDAVFYSELSGGVPIIDDDGGITYRASITGDGVDNGSNQILVRHTQGQNSAFARTGVTSLLGPMLEPSEVFDHLREPIVNDQGDAVFGASTTSPNQVSPRRWGLWKNSPSGNVALSLSGVTGSQGPGLGADEVFYGQPSGYRILNGTNDVIFTATTSNTISSANRVGLWKNAGGANAAVALSGETGLLGPGFSIGSTFADRTHIMPSALEFDTNTRGDIVFASALSDGRKGIWRNLGSGNEPLMVVGESGKLGPGSEFNDVFSHFDAVILKPEPTINDSGVALFPGVLASSKKKGLWLNDGDENSVIALTGEDGALGPGLGPGVKFTDFNRAYFGNDDTVLFTADLNFNVLSNRLLGLFAYRDGEIVNLALYGGLVDVDPGAGIDNRVLRWVQIPEDWSWNGSKIGANTKNQIAFRMGFQDGTQGLFVASPIPEPSPLFTLLQALLITCLSTRTNRRLAI